MLKLLQKLLDTCKICAVSCLAFAIVDKHVVEACAGAFSCPQPLFEYVRDVLALGGLTAEEKAARAAFCGRWSCPPSTAELQIDGRDRRRQWRNRLGGIQTTVAILNANHPGARWVCAIRGEGDWQWLSASAAQYISSDEWKVLVENHWNDR